jgi:hypothetical protein
MFHLARRLIGIRQNVMRTVQRAAGTKATTTAAAPEKTSSPQPPATKKLGPECGPLVDPIDDDDDAGVPMVDPKTGEWGGPTRGGTRPEPTRFGDWERNGRCSDF